MSAPIVKLFTQPNFACIDTRCAEEAHPRDYLSHLLWFNVLTPEYLRTSVS
ncbi:hypothetical protein ABHN98_01485 [Pseudomonas syringae]